MTVYLVGAGPGDPGLLTARALELIATADVIIHDRLIPQGALNNARPDATVLYAGKEGGGPQVSQDDIDAMLVEHGRDPDKTIVRLKGGDPFVFGRGGEEGEILRAEGIAFEVVPGVTAGIAATAYAGIPVTHRELASSVAFVTGHEDPAKPESALDWRALAAFPGTLIVYMGVRQLAAIAEHLIEGGRSPEEPAALVQQRDAAGSASGHRHARRRSPRRPRRSGSGRRRSPCSVLSRRCGTGSPGSSGGPLHGLTVAVTRARAQARGLRGAASRSSGRWSSRRR